MAEVQFLTATPIELGGEQHLGSDEGDLVERGFVARVNDAPIAISIKDILQNAGQEVTSAFYGRFKSWLIPHRISITRLSGLAELITVGCEVEYDIEGTCSVISLIPATEFVEVGSGGISFSGVAKGQMSSTGELSKILEDSNSSEVDLFQETELGLKAEISASAKLNISARIMTPFISATGVGSKRCEFRFDRYKEPLFNRDIETWSVVALPKRLKSLKYRVRFYFVTRTAFVPFRSQSEWCNVTCTLLDE